MNSLSIFCIDNEYKYITVFKVFKEGKKLSFTEINLGI